MNSVSHSVSGAEQPSARTWALGLAGGGQVTGPLPAWADDDPSATGLTPEQLRMRLVDMTHWHAVDGTALDVFLPAQVSGEDTGAVHPEPVLAAAIHLDPYAEDPGHRVPLATVAVLEDCVIADLDPGGLADVIAKLRAQVDRLDQVHADLVQARTEWRAAQ
ncbi:DUF6907 domain-containing protein [Streptomyces sp. NPDC018031]|uniref:DUF6907 domain-containing protein n=1 Tax=Streptomyces sp. NPDC018031 TaxID=3365033 RepID=UPI0037974DC1